MVINTDCPYCSEKLDISQEHTPKAPIAVECPSCGKIFEYIHGFGSFALPREGKGVKASTRSKAIRGKENVEVNFPKRPQIMACFIILSVLAGAMSSIFMLLTPSEYFDLSILVLFIAAIGVLVFVILVMKLLTIEP